MFRKATAADVKAVSNLYEKIHQAESRGEMCIGWLPGVYPVEDTARGAQERGELYVYEEAGAVLAAAILNGTQPEAYARGKWQRDAPAERTWVLHTLVVDPQAGGRGIGRRFVAFYEDMARELGRPFLRMDTNARNGVARRLYAKLGYREADAVPCEFNGIPGVQLVLLEKTAEGFSE